MRILLEALEAAAARGQSVTLTEVVIGPPDGEIVDVDDAYAAAAVAVPGEAAAPAASAASGEQLPMQSEALARIAELETALKQAQDAAQDAAQAAAQAQSAAGGGSNGSGGAAPGATLAAYESYPTSVLGLTEKAQKGVDKCECRTIGEVKVALLAGRLAEKGKGNGNLGRMEVIEVANKLLGQVPAATPPPSAGASTSSAPAGVEPPTWERLLVAVRRKEAATEAQRAQVEQAAATLAQLRAQQITPDVQAQITQAEGAKQSADVMFAMFEGQVACILFAMGLDHDLKQVRTVNGALNAKGLQHLVNEAPAPEGVPQGAAQ